MSSTHEKRVQVLYTHLNPEKTQINPYFSTVSCSGSKSCTPTTETPKSGTSQSLFKPIKIGDISLSHRIVQAPCMRNRSSATGTVAELAELYYGQRASEGGLQIAEACFIQPGYMGYESMAGITTEEHIKAWKPVTQAVHKKGGFIFCQTWHAGRSSEAGPCVGPSAIKSPGVPIFHPEPYGVPHELTQDEIKEIIRLWTKAAENAIAAGFDGVEIHNANAYLANTFLMDSANKRTDKYGGSQANRCRFTLELVDSICASIGPGRLGIRFSPWGVFHSEGDSDPEGLYKHLLGELNGRQLSYVHLIQPYWWPGGQQKNVGEIFRSTYKGVIMVNGAYEADTAEAEVSNGNADMVSFGRYFLSNPDISFRLKRGLALRPFNDTTMYYGNHVGYTDQPPHPSNPEYSSFKSTIGDKPGGHLF